MPSPRLWLLRAAQGRDKPPAMAGYLSPGAYFYAEEQEYLQAYEDVLERYKGRAAPPPPILLIPGCRLPWTEAGSGGRPGGPVPAAGVRGDTAGPGSLAGCLCAGNGRRRVPR